MSLRTQAGPRAILDIMRIVQPEAAAKTKRVGPAAARGAGGAADWNKGVPVAVGPKGKSGCIRIVDLSSVETRRISVSFDVLRSLSTHA